ncbi:serine hydrolase domain-containing protein [Croceitalea rosinachiae]|uniref:Serine hydrolase n=1 Tax=Croceitalea rosinachiae TaxID=3075596 RepID=A0ABU3ADG1_9FLAO|nr:serine hydrolase [Croceitalea sp. F388]MDT0607547.1 serine hydrolase [Croceitalea sp. F388]
MKIFKRILLVFILIIAILVYFNYSKLNIISGYASKYMASSINIGGHSSTYIIENDLAMPLIELTDTEFDTQERTAKASVYGLMTRKAVDRGGLGSVLVNNDYSEGEQYLQPRRNFKKIDKPYPYGHLPKKDTVFENVDYDLLQKAVTLPFSNEAIQKTRTLLVLYKGHLLHESYIDGFDKNTPILGWSMSKSVLATCFGVLQKKGRLKVDWPAPIAEWKDDERRNITLNHLLRMQSGLEWNEDYGGISDVTKMLFLDSDMTKAQLDKMAIAKPTEIWNYSSGTTNLLSGILRQQFRSHQEYLNFPYKSFIDKIGAHSMLIEADLKGNYVGSSYTWATTRDWARIGQLYLDNGKWNDEQLFDAEWIDYITTVTDLSNGTYGAHFWLNAEGKFPDVPKDLYSMNGFQGQYVFIIPSKDLVVVRTGLAEDPEFDINGFLSSLIIAIK